MQQSFVLAGGCFWCLDAAYRQLKGIVGTECAYAGGAVANPSYEQVCTGQTGHAEAFKVTFDDSVISAQTVLDAYFTMHDPTQLNRQGNDIGPQYRSVMFYADADQQQLFEAAIARAQEWYAEPIVTTVEPLANYFPAEEYHQNYYAQNPNSGYCQIVVSGKTAKIRAKFSQYLR